MRYQIPAIAQALVQTITKEGEILDDFIAAHNLKIENKGTEYTFETTLASTRIDITLSNKLAVSVTDWTVFKGENFMDHNDITFKLETEKMQIGIFSQKP